MLGGVFVWGIVLGYDNRPAAERVVGVINKKSAVEEAVTADFSPFWQAWEIIDDNFVAATTAPESQVKGEQRVRGAIAGLVASLDDPYSVFLPPEEKKLFESDLSGTFGGVGMEVDKRDGDIVVVAPLEGTPAKAAGVQTGDRIIKIGDRTAADLELHEAIQLIRGEVGTIVVVTVARDKSPEPLVFKLTRQIIQLPTIDTKVERGVFVIKLHNFGGTASELFRQALRKFVTAGTDKLIIDLRGNPGGYLEAAVDLSSWFLPAGETVVIEDRGGHEDPVHYRSRGYNPFTEQLKMVVLVDGGSASASEIFAGALAEHGRARLVGEKTFGKGSVQELITLDNNGAIKLTVAHWLTPRGNSISENGLKPDIEVVRPEKEKEGSDAQLAKAVDVLLALP